FAEQGFQHHSSLRPRGVACRSGSPEWLTPLAMPVAVNTNKKLRKIGPRTPNSMPQSFLVVNGALMARAGMARAGHEPARNRPLTRNHRQNQPAGKPPGRGRRARRMRAWELARRTDGRAPCGDSPAGALRRGE